MNAPPPPDDSTSDATPIGAAQLDDPDWLRRRAATVSASAIARDVGVAVGTVLRRMRLYGIRPRPAPRRVQRPPQLDDPDWLAQRYATASAATIATELDTTPTAVREALYDAGIAPRGHHDRQQFRTPKELDDPAWLRSHYDAGHSGAEIADELGVSVPAVYAAMRRHGLDLDGPWVRRDLTRLAPPPEHELREMYENDPAIQNIGRRLGVSATTATVWLADIGIFASDTPALSQRQLDEAIANGWSIQQIAKHHRVGPRTVMVELRRHHLRDDHRHRPVVGEQKA